MQGKQYVMYFTKMLTQNVIQGVCALQRNRGGVINYLNWTEELLDVLIHPPEVCWSLTVGGPQGPELWDRGTGRLASATHLCPRCLPSPGSRSAPTSLGREE